VYVYHLHPIGSLLIVLDRTQRVKDARTEAAKEVDAYKTQKETDFKQFELEVSPVTSPEHSLCFVFICFCANGVDM
jgi:hypothetical protein